MTSNDEHSDDKQANDKRESNVQYAVHDGSYVIKLTGDVRLTLCAAIDCFVEKMFADPSLSGVMLDLSHTQAVDSTTLGLLAKIAIGCEKQGHGKPLLACSNADILHMLKSMGLERVFVIIDELTSAELDPPNPVLKDLPRIDSSQQEICQKVLEAHRVLIKLNYKNNKVFKDVVAQLEQESQFGAGNAR